MSEKWFGEQDKDDTGRKTDALTLTLCQEVNSAI
jgi:hypothetical protein